MAEKTDKKPPVESTPPEPKLHPEPPPVGAVEQNGYRKARENISTPEDVQLIENFIGTIYGDAKRIDKANIGSNQFTQGLKFDAKKQIIDVRNTVSTSLNQTQPPTMPSNSTPPPVQPQQAMPLPPVPGQQIDYPPQQSVASPGDSLILKHEIDQIKEQVKEIKKLYDEFFKLKVVKGKWVIKTKEKEQTAPSVAKAWNIINKLLRNKTTDINIVYTENE